MPISSALLDMAAPEALAALGAALPGNHERVSISNGTAGTADTINRMQDLVASGKRHFPFREFVGALVRECPKKDYACYMQTCFNYCRDKIQYVYDPVGVELIEAPWKIIPELGGSGIADCDSICVVMASMAETMGFPARFVTIKADRARPDEFSHVFTEVKVPGKGWMGADATMPNDFGWSPEGYPRQNWPASKDSEDQGHDESVMGMGKIGMMYGMADFIEEDFSSDTPVVDVYKPLDYGPAVSAHPNANVAYTVSPMMHGLGADQGVLDILEGIYNGTIQQDLQSKARKIQDQLSIVRDGSSKALRLSEPARTKAIAAFAAARNQLLDASLKITDAKNTYDGIVDIMATIPGVTAPSKFLLSGMGFLPPAVVAFAVTGSVIAGLALALAALLSQIGGAIHGGDGYIQQGANVLSSAGMAIQQAGTAFSQAGGTVFNFGLLVLVGLAGYVGYEYLKKQGHIGGARA